VRDFDGVELAGWRALGSYRSKWVAEE